MRKDDVIDGPLIFPGRDIIWLPSCVTLVIETLVLFDDTHSYQLAPTGHKLVTLWPGLQKKIDTNYHQT